MHMNEEIVRIREIMNIQEQIPDSRFASSPDGKINSLPGLGLDDTVDVISALIDAVPGIGNLVSAGIDIVHTLSYLVRLFYAKSEDEKIEYATLALVTLGATFIPVGGNSLPIMARQSIKQIIRKTPQEIFILAKKLGLYDKTVILLSKSKWKYSILLALARIVGGELSEFLTYVSKMLHNLYKKLQGIPKLESAAKSVLILLSFVSELSADADIAIKLVKEPTL